MEILACQHCHDLLLSNVSDLYLHTKTCASKSSSGFSCYVCPYATTRDSDILRHIKAHLEKQPFTCKFCAYGAKQEHILEQHIEQIHMGLNTLCIHCKQYEVDPSHKTKALVHCATCTGIERTDPSYNFTCYHCDYHTASRKNMRAHIDTHNGVKPFECNLCAYTARRKAHLDEHMRRHTGEKPHTCGFCGYECVQSSQLMQHMRKIHKLGQES